MTRHVLSLLVVAAFATEILRAEEVTARASVDSTQYLVGDWIAVHVDLRHPAGTAFHALLGDTIGGFHVIARDSVRSEGPQASVTRVVLARYDSGRAVLPPLPFQYSAPGDTVVRTVSTNPLLLTVRTLPVDTAADIRDIRPPLGLPITLAEILVVLGVLIVLAVAAYLWLRYRRRRPAVMDTPAPAAPRRPAHVIALEELADLKEKRLWQQGLVKPYYSGLTEILRRYFENRFRVMALEQTTGEIMTALRLRPETFPVQDDIERVLRLADLVKFAKFQPGVAEHEEALRVAYDVVQKTAPSPAPQGKEASHVAA